MRRCSSEVRKSHFSLLASCGVLLTLFLSACGYTLQTKAQLPFRTVSIASIENRTVEPKLQDRLHRILAETLMEYGFEIDPSSQYRLEGTITRFDLRTVAERDLTTSEYEVFILGDFKLTDTATTKSTLFPGIQSPFITSFTATGKLESVLAQKEIATDTALRNLSQELVRRIVYAAGKAK